MNRMLIIEIPAGPAACLYTVYIYVLMLNPSVVDFYLFTEWASTYWYMKFWCNSDRKNSFYKKRDHYIYSLKHVHSTVCSFLELFFLYKLLLYLLLCLFILMMFLFFFMNTATILYRYELYCIYKCVMRWHVRHPYISYIHWIYDWK